MLHSTTAGQLLTFLSYVFWGIVLSAIFHIISCIRFKKHSGILRLVLEGFFGACALVGLWWANLIFNDGQFRLFVVLALGLGILLYYKICKSPLDKAFNSLYNYFTKKIADRTCNENNIPK